VCVYCVCVGICVCIVVCMEGMCMYIVCVCIVCVCVLCVWACVSCNVHIKILSVCLCVAEHRGCGIRLVTHNFHSYFVTNKSGGSRAGLY